MINKNMIAKKQIEMIYLKLDGKLTGKYGSSTTNSDVMPFVLDCDIGWFQEILDKDIVHLASSCESNGDIFGNPDDIPTLLSFSSENYLEIDISTQINLKHTLIFGVNADVILDEEEVTRVFLRWKRGEWLVRRGGYILNVYTTEELQEYFEQEGI